MTIGQAAGPRRVIVGGREVFPLPRHARLLPPQDLDEIAVALADLHDSATDLVLVVDLKLNLSPRPV